MLPAKRMNESYDAVVVGARCAGAATAMLLARQGLSVLLVDRDRHGADTLSTLALMRAGVLQLHRWGLLEQLARRGHTGDPKVRPFIYGDETIAIPIKARDGVDALYAPRRTVLDALLADAASTAGADVLVRPPPRRSDCARRTGRVVGAVIEDARPHRCIGSGAGIVDRRRRTEIDSGARLVECPDLPAGHGTPAAVVYAFWPGLGNPGNRWYFRARNRRRARSRRTTTTRVVFAATPCGPIPRRRPAAT